MLIKKRRKVKWPVKMLNIFMWREDSTRAFWLIETKSWSVNCYRVRKNIGSFNPKISLFWRLLWCAMIVIVAIFLNRKLSELYMVYWLFTHDLRCAHFDYVPVIACIRFLKFIRFFIANILSKKSGSFFITLFFFYEENTVNGTRRYFRFSFHMLK